METRKISMAGFHATFTAAMETVPDGSKPPFDFMTYFLAIPLDDFEGHTRTEASIQAVYQNSTGQYQHVLMRTGDKNVFMVVILDLFLNSVYGHTILDLNKEFGNS